MHEKIYNHGMERLRDPARLALLELDRVIDLSMADLPAAPLSVLDIGCGTGVFAEAFLKRNCTTAGIDINQEMIAEAQRLVPRGNFKSGSAEKIPFEDHSFDIVFYGMVLHESDDLPSVLAEARRVTRLRVVAHEWPYVTAEKGPPLAHRLNPVDLAPAADKAGLGIMKTVQLQTLVVYRWDISH